jgi:hypothetical protein
MQVASQEEVIAGTIGKYYGSVIWHQLPPLLGLYGWDDELQEVESNYYWKEMANQQAFQ